MTTFEEVWTATDRVEGMFLQDEARLLWNCARRMKVMFPDMPFLEVGSYRGRSATVLTSVGMTILIEPSWLWHDPSKGSFDGTPTKRWQYTDEMFDVESYAALRRNLNGRPYVLIGLPSRSVKLAGPFSLIFIDGNHKPGGVDVDCEKFLPCLVSSGIAAFHDYDQVDYPELQEIVDKATEGWQRIGQAGSLLAVAKP